MKPTLATPVRATSKPTPAPLPPLVLGSSSSLLAIMSMPTCALRSEAIPRWNDVALFFWVLAIYDRRVSNGGGVCDVRMSHFGLDIFDL
jgi:hypothetical protein